MPAIVKINQDNPLYEVVAIVIMSHLVVVSHGVFRKRAALGRKGGDEPASSLCALYFAIEITVSSSMVGTCSPLWVLTLSTVLSGTSAANPLEVVMSVSCWYLQTMGMLGK